MTTSGRTDLETATLVLAVDEKHHADEDRDGR
jgi:hypothetical protein